MINIKDFDPNLKQINKKSYENIGTYSIRYITMKNYHYVKVDSVNPLHIIINKVDGFIGEKMEINT